MKNRIVILISILMVISLWSLGAQESGIIEIPKRELGDWNLNVDAGFFIPLSFLDYSGNFNTTNLSLGGYIGLSISGMLTSFFSIGGELGGTFNLSPNTRSLLLVPILVKFTFYIYFQHFEMPIFFGIGTNFVRYRDWYQFDFMIKGGLGLLYRFNPTMSVGLQTQMWIDFQPTTKFQTSDQARIGFFVDISPTLIYSF